MKMNCLERSLLIFFLDCSPINEGPINLNSTVLNPFSPVPTNDITNPIAIVPKPTYRKALANELGPLSTPKRSSSSEDPPKDESCIYRIANKHIVMKQYHVN